MLFDNSDATTVTGKNVFHIVSRLYHKNITPVLDVVVLVSL